ncbi:hypothetical protein FXO38_34208 [Capsicum annuum]|nr:hypothetical protein FXO38_34208 [Capsicum annuum]
MNENQPPRQDKEKAKISCEDLGEDFDITDFDGESLCDVDENIKELSDFDEDLLQARKSNIKKQAKEKVDRVNLYEIPSRPVDPDSDISDEEEGDPVDDDEVEKDFSSSCRSQPIVQASTSTVAVAAAERDANTSIVEEVAANAKSSNRRPTNAHSVSKGAGRPVNAHSAPRAVGRPTNVASVGGVRPASASTADIRPAAIVMPTTTSAVGDNATQSTTQQSTSGVGP